MNFLLWPAHFIGVKVIWCQVMIEWFFLFLVTLGTDNVKQSDNLTDRKKIYKIFSYNYKILHNFSFL